MSRAVTIASPRLPIRSRVAMEDPASHPAAPLPSPFYPQSRRGYYPEKPDRGTRETAVPGLAWDRTNARLCPARLPLRADAVIDVAQEPVAVAREDVEAAVARIVAERILVEPSQHCLRAV